MAADGAEPKLIGYMALRTISRTAGLLTRRGQHQVDEPGHHKVPGGGAGGGGGGGGVTVDLVNGKLLQTIHGISLIQVSSTRPVYTPLYCMLLASTSCVCVCEQRTRRCSTCKYKISDDLSQGWLGSRVVSMLDSGAEGHGFNSQSRRCRVTVFGKLFTPIVPLFTKQRNW